MIMKFKTSIQRELDRFVKAISDDDFNIRAVTKSAFTQARAKLNPLAFKRLNEITVKAFYSEASILGWAGMRTLAIDGSKLMLPNHPSIKETFGETSYGPKADSKRSMALASMLYDVHNLVVLDAQIDRYDASERDLMRAHLDFVDKGDLLLLDRGYGCFWLLFLLKAKGIEFCIRMKDDWWKEVHTFSESNQTDKIVYFELPKKDQDKLSEYPEIINQKIACRLVKVILDNGEIEILCTSLMDTKKVETEDFKELYHYRWNEEEAFKLLKSRIELEDFSGKTARAVQQDFYAKIFLMTLCSAYAHPIEEKVRQEFIVDDDHKHPQKINRTNALANLMDLLVPIYIKKKIRKALKVFDDIVFRTREMVRKGRSFERKKRPRKNYSMNYKKL
jgi:hypothetical protein